MWSKILSLFFVVNQQDSISSEVWQTIEETRGILGIEQDELLESIYNGRLKMKVIQGIPMIDYKSIRRYYV